MIRHVGEHRRVHGSFTIVQCSRQSRLPHNILNHVTPKPPAMHRDGQAAASCTRENMMTSRDSALCPTRLVERTEDIGGTVGATRELVRLHRTDRSFADGRVTLAVRPTWIPALPRWVQAQVLTGPTGTYGYLRVPTGTCNGYSFSPTETIFFAWRRRRRLYATTAIVHNDGDHTQQRAIVHNGGDWEACQGV